VEEPLRPRAEPDERVERRQQRARADRTASCAGRRVGVARTYATSRTLDVDLLQVTLRKQFIDAWPGLAHFHAEVVRQVGRCPDAARSGRDAQQLAPGFVRVERRR